uniref:Rab-GAP TBC domain-containing protein n=1 Tax=Trichogramma kaykai TaxID=54128 RepID=A0ABD2WE25_9HYME
MSGLFNSLRNLATGATNAPAIAASAFATAIATPQYNNNDDEEDEEMKMKFSLTPQPGENGFTQWLDAMKMVAKLQGGIPAEFRRKLWCILAERHLEQRGVNWNQAEKICFNEWSNPDDEELGVQIVKDLHRTGCSLFCGVEGRDNQAVLRRVLLGFARWNKSVGYCQGLNVLAALILQVVDRDEAEAVKVMIHLIEGVLPEGYFADSLRGLSIDMAVFRDLLRMRLPRLSKHLESLQSDPKDPKAGKHFEPPLTNVFTMQWFLTLFCHCLPQDAVLRVWDLIFLEGDDVLLRTALAIWEGLSERIMTVHSADEFYSIMGVLAREMLEFTDTNHLVKTIVGMGRLNGVTSLREKHRYNITPWARRLSDDEESETDDERLGSADGSRTKKSATSTTTQALAPTSERERLALDISTLKQQYAKLRERQRQAHIILSAACARQTMVTTAATTTGQAMNHLLVGKNALMSAKNRQLGPNSGSLIARAKAVAMQGSPRIQARKQQQQLKPQQQQQQPVTIYWKDTKKRKDEREDSKPVAAAATAVAVAEAASAVITNNELVSFEAASSSRRSDSDSDSTSTELCDEPDRLSEFDSSEEPTSTSECGVQLPHDVERSSPAELRVRATSTSSDHFDVSVEETSIAQITDQIRRLSADDADVKTSFDEEDLVLVKNNEKSPIFSSVTSGGTLDVLKKSAIDKDLSARNEATSNELLTRQNFEPNEEVRVENLPVNYVDRQSPVPLLSNSESKDTESSKEVSPEIKSEIVYSKEQTEVKSDTQEEKKLTDTEEFDSLSNQSPINNSKVSQNIRQSPKTPESPKSYSSGETMGPDSVTSSLAATPHTPAHPESRDFVEIEKSTASSISSESTKTVTVKSPESDVAIKLAPDTPVDKSPVTLSTDSVMLPKSTEQPCSSTESFCSPNKLKLSERDFSSELQSPVSANSIKFATSYSYKSDGVELLEPSSDIGSVTSPFYPIRNPNQNTPSPYEDDKSKSNRDIVEFDQFCGLDVDKISKPSTENEAAVKAFDLSQLNIMENPIDIKISDESSLNGNLRKLYTDVESENSIDDRCLESEKGRTSAFEVYRKYRLEEEIQDIDMLSPVFRTQSEHRNDLFERSRGKSLDGKLETLEITGVSYDRSNSSLEKRFPEMLLSPSMEDFASSSKKRSSDVLEDVRHLETKISEDGEIDPNMLTRKTSVIWEDLKCLEARRQDTFSDSASTFSKEKIDVPGICISTVGRKTYIVEPKINIDESSDSILKSVTYKNGSDRNESDDDGKESKLGVWTKVKPRKRDNNGRRSSSDRALKIIQENSAILQKILTCQAKRRLPDLEEITKEITISPINEEISKIFSPILEKIGLNEHEINEELAKINFKDLDRTTATTTASEFEAKINEELSKLSIIGDNEEVAYLPDVDDISNDYLMKRDAFIDRQINDELSKLIINYRNNSPSDLQISPQCLNINDKIPSPTNIYSYTAPDDPLKIKNDLVTGEELDSIMYTGNPISYLPRNDYSSMHPISAKSDIDIYHELEKLDKLSHAQVLPVLGSNLANQNIEPSALSYISNELRSPTVGFSPSLIAEKKLAYDVSPLKSPYNSPYSSNILNTSPYDYRIKLSPGKSPDNLYSVRPYDNKDMMDTGFENSIFELTRKAVIPKGLDYEYGTGKPVVSKEHLEFRLCYDRDDADLIMKKKSINSDIDLKLSPFETSCPELDKGATFYSTKQIMNPSSKYSPSGIKSLDPDNFESNFRAKNYNDSISVDKYSSCSDNYGILQRPYKITPLETQSELPAYVNSNAVKTQVYQDPELMSPHYAYANSCKNIQPMGNEPIIYTNGRSKHIYSDISSPSSGLETSSLTLSGISETKPLDNYKKYDYDTSPTQKPLGFSPFPVRNITRNTQEIGLTLGRYTPTNSTHPKLT